MNKLNFNHLPLSVIESCGERVTTICKLGGIGLGYILKPALFKNNTLPINLINIAWKSGANGFYHPKLFKEIHNDNGKRYIETVKSI